MAGFNDGGSAFPVMPPQDEHGDRSASGYPFPEAGMSLRDWFAGQALAGMLADPSVRARPADVAEVSYNYANAMLVAREKGKN